ncbi:uncharacterized protein [Branchiostoma lanceolatum]|uniref:uncharacterized protein n=1 Tax=Branchiostoma lanceolatum TaxID=7740 RepID=UPI0034551AB1
MPEVTTVMPEVTTVMPEVTTVLKSDVTTVLKSDVTTVLKSDVTTVVKSPAPAEFFQRQTKEMKSNKIQTITRKGTAIACEGETKLLSCPAGETIVIDDANYGRTSATDACPCPCNDINCRAANSLPFVWKACQGLQRCPVTASHHIFGDPCFGTAKYLRVTYRCFSACSNPFGMSSRSGDIPDVSITASSHKGRTYEPYRGRLYGVAGVGAWEAINNNIGEWLQVDLGEMERVTGTITQGRHYDDGDVHWVTSYKLQYSANGTGWTTYTDSDGSEKVFPGNSDMNTPVTNLLDYPIDARYVRFVVQSWHNWISMRTEVLGCSTNNECQAEPYMRYECGWGGINADQCRQRTQQEKALEMLLRLQSNPYRLHRLDFTSLSPLSTDCPIGDYIRFKGVCYKSFAEEKTRDEASETCAEDGGMLAMPKDSETNNFLPKLEKAVQGRWIGLTDTDRDGQWVFEDGEALMPSNYSNWCPEEPKPKNSRGGCAGFWGSESCWGEKDCEWRKPFICQLKPGSARRQYTSLGCWRDSGNRAIPTLEGTDSRLDGSYGYRQNPTKKCYQVALSRGFTVFAVQHGGQCHGSADGHNAYFKYGPSTGCNADGEGGNWANEVYQITNQSPRSNVG